MKCIFIVDKIVKFEKNTIFFYLVFDVVEDACLPSYQETRMGYQPPEKLARQRQM
jgi:hypothetical protein